MMCMTSQQVYSSSLSVPDQVALSHVSHRYYIYRVNVCIGTSCFQDPVFNAPMGDESSFRRHASGTTLFLCGASHEHNIT